MANSRLRLYLLYNKSVSDTFEKKLKHFTYKMHNFAWQKCVLYTQLLAIWNVSWHLLYIQT